MVSNCPPANVKTLTDKQLYACCKKLNLAYIGARGRPTRTAAMKSIQAYKKMHSGELKKASGKKSPKKVTPKKVTRKKARGYSHMIKKALKASSKKKTLTQIRTYIKKHYNIIDPDFSTQTSQTLKSLVDKEKVVRVKGGYKIHRESLTIKTGGVKTISINAPKKKAEKEKAKRKERKASQRKKSKKQPTLLDQFFGISEPAKPRSTKKKPKKVATPKAKSPSPKKMTPKAKSPSPKKMTPKARSPSPKKTTPKAKSPSPKKLVTPKVKSPSPKKMTPKAKSPSFIKNNEAVFDHYKTKVLYEFQSTKKASAAYFEGIFRNEYQQYHPIPPISLKIFVKYILAELLLEGLIRKVKGDSPRGTSYTLVKSYYLWVVAKGVSIKGQGKKFNIPYRRIGKTSINEFKTTSGLYNLNSEYNVGKNEYIVALSKTQDEEVTRKKRQQIYWDEDQWAEFVRKEYPNWNFKPISDFSKPLFTFE